MSIKNLYIVALSLMGLVFAGFVYNESRKEIHYLCSNFIESMPKVIVEEQLATANWSTAEEVHPRKIVMYSGLNLYIHRCTIDFDLQRKVTQADYSSF